MESLRQNVPALRDTPLSAGNHLSNRLVRNYHISASHSQHNKSHVWDFSPLVSCRLDLKINISTCWSLVEIQQRGIQWLKKVDCCCAVKIHFTYFALTFPVQSRMMLTGSSASPFAAIESAIYKTLFIGFPPYAALTGDLQESCVDRTASTSTNKESAVSRVDGKNGSLQAKDESENTETKSCKKIN